MHLVHTPRPQDGPPPLVLLPGCGLSRLCCEVAHLGYHAQGNEFSYHMLLTSAFVLNEFHVPNQYTIYPWMHSNCNHRSDADQLRPVGLPDVPPSQLVPGPDLLSMCAGDFVVRARQRQREARGVGGWTDRRG